jgi:DNA invertase Pin-like site-specific DNA recombinase
MKPGANSSKLQRCAVYTRKSTEHNLGLAFNSLDAQREACEAYIKSQAHERWRLVADRFDDGGLSGASLDREALARLLDLVRAGRVDVIVVYKVDRLTRSLSDFAKLVELFDAHGVSFVSVTQAFNTTTSMGRLTLNVLLSFAQFEREVIGERVRDKIAASKRKGIWVGGPVPLGYRVQAKKLVVVPEEAEMVRTIFRRYLEAGSLSQLATKLAQRGICPPQRSSRRAAERFRTGPLAHILKNRCYLGETVYRGEAYPGEHEAIIDQALFNAVQERLRDQAVHRRSHRSQSQAILTGLLFDDAGNRMTPSHASKRGVRYRYYVSQALLQNRKAKAGSVTRVSAPALEELVLTTMQRELATADDSSERVPASATELLPHLQRVVLRRRSVAIELVTTPAKHDPTASAPILADEGDQRSASEELRKISVPFKAEAFIARKGIMRSDGAPAMDPDARDALLAAVALARSWANELMGGTARSLAEIAARENKAERYVRRLIALAWLSPRIIEAIAEGRASTITLRSLTSTLPQSWGQQERMLAK